MLPKLVKLKREKIMTKDSRTNEAERLKLQPIMVALNVRVERIWVYGNLMSHVSGRECDDWNKVVTIMGVLLVKEAVAMMELLDRGMCPGAKLS